MKYISTSFLAFIIVLTVARAEQLQAPQQVQPKQTSTSQSDEKNAFQNAMITYNIIDAANITYGYDIYVNGKLTIHQTSIPALPGNDGFKTKDDAAKVAKLVMEKMKKGEVPPTVTTDELTKLNVIK